MKTLSKLIFLLLANCLFAQSPVFYNVTDYGLSGDGKTVNTQAFQKLIDVAAIKGGTIYFPAGRFLTGSVELKDNIDIYISRGAEILGSTNLSDYTPHKPKLESYNDYFLLYSLFYAEKANNISIRGEGTINGQGSAFKVTTNKKPDRYKDRPFIIRFVECRNVRIEGLYMTSSAMWMQQYLACENLFISKVNVFNHANKNNDMMDVDGCKNVVISDCIGDTDDDGITLKSTLPKLTENVTIKNCIISSHCNALKTGTESTGGFKNIVVSNLIIKPSQADSVITGAAEGITGINISTVDGGIIDGIIISDVVINGPKVPFFLRHGSRLRKYKDNAKIPETGSYKNVMISNLIAENVKSIGCPVTGIPGHPLENISLNNISISFSGGGSREDASKIMQELEDQYPEATMWGNLPSYGIYVRHAKGVDINNIKFSFNKDDARPAIKIDDADDLMINGLKAKISPEASSVINIMKGNNITIENSGTEGIAGCFLSVNDPVSADIRLIQNDLGKYKKAIEQKSPGQVIMINNPGIHE